MNYKSVVYAVVRVILYTIPVILAAQVIVMDASLLNDGVKFGENSYTEWLQELFLLLTSIVFLWAGFVHPGKKAIAYLMSGGALVAFIREFDWLFDRIYQGAWFPIALVALGVTLWGVYRKRSQIWENLEEFFKQPAYGAFLSGFITVFVFSRLFGRKIVWRAVFEVEKLASMQRWVKNACEEGIELLGYVLLLIAAIEYLVFVYKTRRLDV